MADNSYLSFVKLDFLLAVGLTVVVPLLLLFLSFPQKPLLYRLLAYWRVSSLLVITVYLLMAELSIGLASGVVARVLIPPVLWLGDSFMHSGTRLLKSYTSIYRWFHVWRLLLTIYCVAGVIFTLPLLACGVSGYVTEQCAVWFIPPQMFGSLLHPHSMWVMLGQYASIALLIYGVYLATALLRLLLRRISA